MRPLTCFRANGVPLLAIFGQAATYEWRARLKIWWTHLDMVCNGNYIFFRIYRGG